MNKIKSYARVLELMCIFVGIPFIVGAFLFKWFCGDFPIYSDAIDCTIHSRLFTGIGYFYNAVYAQMPPPMVVRLVAAAVDGISIGLFLWGSICFIRLLRYYSAGELFSANTLALYTKLSRILFAWTLYNPLKFTLLSYITTMLNPAGKRVIAIAFNSDDIFYIFIVGFFLVITSLMQEAYNLKHEQDLTV